MPTCGALFPFSLFQKPIKNTPNSTIINLHDSPPPPPPPLMAHPSPSPPRNDAPEASSPSPSPGPSPSPPVILLPPQSKRRGKSIKAFRAIHTALRSFPIPSLACRLHASVPWGNAGHSGHIPGATRTTGTLFGHRKGRITLAIQEKPRSIPLLLLELGIPTAKFMQEMTSGLLRVALECKKQAANKTKLLDEPLWTAFINGRKIGYAARRAPTEDDLRIMQMLHAVSMGAGMLPDAMSDPVDGELTYMRAYFDRVIGNKDSETFHMLNLDPNNGPELSVFFLRI